MLKKLKFFVNLLDRQDSMVYACIRIVIQEGDAMLWDFNSGTPVYVQITEQIKFSIAIGELKAGEKLLSVRELAAEAEVNPNTMQKALSGLEREGLLFTHRTAGRFVTEDTGMIAQLREKLAAEQIGSFLKNMGKLGYSPEESAEMLKVYQKLRSRPQEEA